PDLMLQLEEVFPNLRCNLILRYRFKISLIGAVTVSLSEHKATVAGSDIAITDVVMQEKDIDELISTENAKKLSGGNKKRRNLDYYKKGAKDNKKGRKKDTRKPRPKRPSRPKSKYYKNSN